MEWESAGQCRGTGRSTSSTGSADRYFLVLTSSYKVIKVFQASAPSDYQFKYFSTEETLLDWIQTGPTTTLLDVPGPEVLQFYGQGTLLCLMTVLAYIAFT